MRQPLVVGNWKMHGSWAENDALVDELRRVLADDAGPGVAVCPPYPYIVQVRERLGGVAIALGAQNVAVAESGAFTGEVSAAMLADIGCRYVIVGHSERRIGFGESDLQVAEKVAISVKHGLTPILCVGESLEEREGGLALDVVGGQLQAVLEAVGPEVFARVVLAYEPLWAIGTGRTASPEQAQEVHEYLRSVLGGNAPEFAATVRILYGGSVNAANAESLFAMDDIDGALVGGASLSAEAFSAIVRSAS